MECQTKHQRRRRIVFQQEIQGAANIITENRRMIERVFDKFRDLMKNGA
jgi:hypothetical protein